MAHVNIFPIAFLGNSNLFAQVGSLLGQIGWPIETVHIVLYYATVIRVGVNYIIYECI